MDDITRELREISRILSDATLLDSVRREVRAAMKEERVLVMGGEFNGNPNFDVVVTHNCGDECNGMLTRRLNGALKNVEIKKLDSIVDNVLGIRFSRRGQYNESGKTSTSKTG